MRPAGLLVWEEGEDHVAPWTKASASPVAQDREDHGVHVLHVDSATSPDEAVLDDAAQRRNRPFRGNGRHDVQMPVHQ